MLKRLVVNQKIIPVPVPLRNLAEVCSWVEETLVGQGQTVTSSLLDGKDILNIWGSEKVCASISVHSETRLDVRIESPEDLALQSLDAVFALAGAILAGLKNLAVHLWQARKNDIQPELKIVIEDIALICELCERLWEMELSDKINLIRMREILVSLQDLLKSLRGAMEQGDWKKAAQMLLRDTPSATGLETILRDLAAECEASHAQLTKAMKSGFGGLEHSAG